MNSLGRQRTHTLFVNSRDLVPGVWGEELLRARSNWRHAFAVTLPITGESNKIKNKNDLKPDYVYFTCKVVVLLIQISALST